MGSKFTTRLMGRVTDDQKFKLDQAATRAGVSTQRMLRWCIERALNDFYSELSKDADRTLVRVHMNDANLAMEPTQLNRPRTPQEVDDRAIEAEVRMDRGAKELQANDNGDD